MLDDLLAFVQHRRPIGHGDGLHEARFPVGGIQIQGCVEHLICLHGQDALFTDVLDGAALLQVSMAEGGRVFGAAQIIGRSLFQVGNRLVELAGVVQLFPGLRFLLVAGLRRDQDIYRPGQERGVESGIDRRGDRGRDDFCDAGRPGRWGRRFEWCGYGLHCMRCIARWSRGGFSHRCLGRHSPRCGPIQVPSQANSQDANSNYSHNQSFHICLSVCRPQAADSHVSSDNAKSARKRAHSSLTYFGGPSLSEL